MLHFGLRIKPAASVVHRSSVAAASAPGAGKLSRPTWKKPKGMTVPGLIAFDLDGTLWFPEMYMLRGGAPFRRDASGTVYDSAGTKLELMGNSAAILKELATDPKWENTTVAYVSRTEYPEWAIPALKTIIISDSWGESKRGRGHTGPVSMWDLCDNVQEIYPGSKISHFKAIKAQTSVAFDDMVFYDNENWNIKECSRLGITCVYTPDGMTPKTWKEGIDRYAEAVKRRGEEER